jgi:hypothetical protein
MKISEYIEQKQKLLEAHGVKAVLVPIDQIDDTIEQIYLSPFSDASSCPYCQVFYLKWNCNGCPMKEAGNHCGNSKSTYEDVLRDLKDVDIPVICKIDNLPELIEQYNKEIL